MPPWPLIHLSSYDQFLYYSSLHPHSSATKTDIIILQTNDVASAAMNGVEIMASWFTPTVLFCILNLMIGTIFITSTLKPHRKHQNIGDSDGEQHPPQLVRVPSFFQRVKSINLSRHPPQQPDPTHYAVPAQEQAETAHQQEPESEEPHHVTKSKSDTATKTAPAARMMKKSASEKVMSAERSEEVNERRPATVREKTTAAEDEAVDEKADDFINRFRQQLKLQRLDSILRYKEMLNRGTAR